MSTPVNTLGLLKPSTVSGGGSSSVSTPSGGAGADFGNTLKDLLSKVEDSSETANDAIGKMIDGSGDVHEAMIAMQHADVMLQMTVQIRNKLVQAYQDVMGAQTPLAMAALPSVMTQIQSGLLRPLAVTSEKRWPTLPDVTSIAESGYPGFSHMTWIGILVPTGTPPAVIAKLNREIAAALANPEVRERIVAMGAEPVGRSTADFDAMLKAEYEITGTLAARIGLKVD